MAWSGGNYTKGNNATGGWVGDASLGIGIEAGRHDTQDDDFATGINQCLNKDGSNAATGNLNLGGNKLTNVAVGTASTDGITLGQAQAGISTSGTALEITNTRFSADAVGPQFAIQKSRGAAVGTNTIVSSGDSLGAIYFRGANGTSYTNAAIISCEVDGTPGASNDMPGRITFATTADGAGTASERMRITAGGFLFVNTTTNFSADRMCLAYDATQNGLGIRDNNDTSGTTFAVFRNSTNGICGSVTRVTTTNAVNYNTSSDYRLKENVAPIADGLQRTLQLKPVSFDWIDSSESSEGFIAHEVAEVFPHAVSGIKDDIDENGQPKYQGVDYGKITPILAAAIKELNAKVEALEARIAALEA